MPDALWRPGSHCTGFDLRRMTRFIMATVVAALQRMAEKQAATAAFEHRAQRQQRAVNGEESLCLRLDAARPPMAAKSPDYIMLRLARISEMLA